MELSWRFSDLQRLRPVREGFGTLPNHSSPVGGLRPGLNSYRFGDQLSWDFGAIRHGITAERSRRAQPSVPWPTV